MSDMLILCPTRARPDNARRLHQEVCRTVDRLGSVDLVFCIDSNDPKLVEYLVAAQDHKFYYTTDKPKRLGPWLNHMTYDGISDDYDVIGFMGDDVVPKTHGWDRKILDAMQPNGIVYGNDGWQGEGLPTAVFMDARMVENAGYMVYPELVHLYIDNHWKAWGEALGTLTYLPDVLLEHMHPFAGKAETDAVYEAANAPDMYTTDGQAFDRFVKEELPELVKRLG